MNFIKAFTYLEENVKKVVNLNVNEITFIDREIDPAQDAHTITLSVTDCPYRFWVSHEDYLEFMGKEDHEPAAKEHEDHDIADPDGYHDSYTKIYGTEGPMIILDKYKYNHYKRRYEHVEGTDGWMGFSASEIYSVSMNPCEDVLNPCEELYNVEVLPEYDPITTDEDCIWRCTKACKELFMDYISSGVSDRD